MSAKTPFVVSGSGIAKTLAMVLVAIIIVGGIISAYEVLQSISSSPTDSQTTPTAPPNAAPNPTPTPATTPAPASPTPNTPPTPTPIPTITPTPTPNPGGQNAINVTGHALYELSQTEFVFSDGTKTYNVTMDLTTRAINLNGKLLGGYQIVSQIIPVTSLPLTITGTVSGSTITAQTILIPTTKDKIT